MNTTLEWMVLSQLPGIGPMGFHQLVEYFGDPGTVLKSSRKKLEQIPGIRKSVLKGLGLNSRQRVLENCLKQLALLDQMGGFCITCEDEDYPQLLKEMGDCPPLLYLLGDKKILNGCSLGTVGSRAATGYGHRTAFSFSRKLAEQGVTIVSGMALGIDTECHRGALAADGKTVAVLGCGVDIVYPRQNRELYEQIRQRGVIISEYPLKTAPEGFRFPARNRIIAGMSRGVLVVEAAKRSGSLITAQIALNEGRDVFAVPGQVDSYKSEGTHWLLQQGAKLVQSEGDILEELPVEQNPGSFRASAVQPYASLEPAAVRLLEIIEPYPCSRDSLMSRSGLAVPEFSELLLILELEGHVEILPGDEICRVSPEGLRS